MNKLHLISIALMLLTAGLSTPARAGEEKRLTVFAAASLTDVMQQLSAKWLISSEANQPKPRLSFAASAIMARQIKVGAPADIFISANPEWIAYLHEANLTVGSAIPVAQNQLVLAAPKFSTLSVSNPLSGPELLALHPSKPFAIADPSTAPAGRYAQRFLQRIGVWQKLAGQLAYSSNVRQTLVLIERGGLTGFVYGTDALASKLVKVIYKVPPHLSGTIEYQAVRIVNSGSGSGSGSESGLGASDFLAFLNSTSAQSIWQKAGFGDPSQNGAFTIAPQ
ncbi:MAG: molybdate ABC transporter substrate-binding protein [Kordiimonadaceae bacterium]|nr:molybdate ABC transporter substrate-binding protein [Kordiimonadaceae bacterium]